MKRWGIIGLILGLGILNVGVASAGQIPSTFLISFPDNGGSNVFYNDLSGSGSYFGLDASWTVNDFDAEITFNGTYVSTTYAANFVFYWEFIGDTMPLSVSITSSTASQYTVAPAFQLTSDDELDVSMYQWSVSGDLYFGHYFPDAELVFFQVVLLDSAQPYDMTITMDWGPGVPTEAVTLGQVKCLYR